jgi:hypothetical protein
MFMSADGEDLSVTAKDAEIESGIPAARAHGETGTQTKYWPETLRPP